MQYFHPNVKLVLALRLNFRHLHRFDDTIDHLLLLPRLLLACVLEVVVPAARWPESQHPRC